MVHFRWVSKAHLQIAGRPLQLTMNNINSLSQAVLVASITSGIHQPSLLPLHLAAMTYMLPHTLHSQMLTYGLCGFSYPITLHSYQGEKQFCRLLQQRVLQKERGQEQKLRQKVIRKEASKLRRRRLKLSGFKPNRKERKKIENSGSSGGVIIESAVVETGDNSQDSGSVAAT